MAWRSWQPVCGAARAEINASGARRPRRALEPFPFRLNRNGALFPCFDAFSSREPVSTPDQVQGRLSLENALIGRGQIIDDLANVGIVDRRAIDLDHLRDFGLPEVLLEFRPARLGADVVRRVTGGAVVLHHFKVWSGLERRGFAGKLVG